MKGRPITEKRKKFCYEYMKDFSGKYAAIRAGYKANNAEMTASKMLKDERVWAFLKTLKDKANKILEISHQDMLMRLKNWIESDITETIGLTPLQIKELPIELKRLITEYKHKKQYYVPKKGADPDSLIGVVELIELKFVSKEKAVDMVNRHIGFYDQDNKQKRTSLDISNVSSGTLEEIVKCLIVQK